MIDRVAASTQIQFERRLEFVDDLFETQLATNIYRVAQEALNNVMRHAQPTCARVELRRDLRHVQLIIQDNGRGFDVSNGHREKGIGLAEMGERVRILNGRMEIATQPGAGTKITATIPVDEAKATSISPAPRV
jgi:signal transduction histidine kinase